jgi:hypothetical protein
VVREIRTAREKVHGATKVLDDTSQQLATLERSLGLVEEEQSLQTADVAQQVQVITGIAEEMKAWLDRLAIEQQKKPAAQFMRALKSGDREDRELQKIFERLDRARGELILRISAAQVGLVGNLEDGFGVAFDVLTETNDKVKQVLGINLALMDRLRDRAPLQIGTCGLGNSCELSLTTLEADGMVPLDASDAEDLGLCDVQDAAHETTTHTDETSIHDNIMLSQARIMTGNVGMGHWQRVSGRKTTIAHNKFRGDTRIMTGDQGGEAAAHFNENFWV